MDLSKIGLFQLMTGKLDYLSHRQTVLAQNIANADTPEYRPRDLKAFDFRTVLAETTATVRPTLTDPAHQTGTVRDRGIGKEVDLRRPYETKPDGNSVVLEEQMTKVSETSIDYETVLNLYRKHVGMIRTVIGRGGGG